MDTNDTWVTEGEAGILLGVTATGVRVMHESGRLKARKITGRRHYRLDDVMAYAAARAARPPETRGRPSAATLLRRRGLLVPA